MDCRFWSFILAPAETGVSVVGVRAEGSFSTTDALLLPAASLATLLTAGEARASSAARFLLDFVRDLDAESRIPGSSTAGVGGCEALSFIFGRGAEGVAVGGFSVAGVGGADVLRKSRGAMVVTRLALLQEVTPWDRREGDKSRRKLCCVLGIRP